LVTEHLPGGINNNLEPCDVVDGQVIPPTAGGAACYHVKTDDDGLTPGTYDDLSEACVDDGWNLEFEIVRAPGEVAAGGTTVDATCEISEFPQVDCPGLP
jgi:hypothetical protein